MSTAYQDPASDAGVNEWIRGGGPPTIPADHYDCVDDGVRSPATNGDGYLVYHAGSTPNQREEFGLTASPSDVGEVTSIDVVAYGYVTPGSGTGVDIQADVYIAGGWLGPKALGMGTGAGYGSASWNGSWTKGQVDAAHVAYIAGGTPSYDSYYNLDWAYAGLTYTPADVTGALTCGAVTVAACEGGLSIGGETTAAASTSASAAGALALGGELTCAATTAAACEGSVGTLGALTCAAVTSASATGSLVPGGRMTCAAVSSAACEGALTPGGALTCAAVSTATCGGGSTPLGSLTCASVTSAACEGALTPGGALTCAAASAAVCAGALALGGELTCATTTLTTASGILATAIFLSVPGPATHRLSWTHGGTVHLVIDGMLVASVDCGYVDLSPYEVARAVLMALVTLPDSLPGPLDQVRLAWTADAEDIIDLQRRLEMGAFGSIATLSSGASGHLDGPLTDGTYGYRAIATSPTGQGATSGEVRVTLDAAPAPPTNLSYSWDAGTGTLTVTWTAGATADVATYRVRSSEGDELLDLSDTPVQDSAALSWSRVFTTETGRWIVLVRAVDASGREEQGIAAVLSLDFADGAPVATPAEPRIVEAYNVAGGKVALDVLYDPRFEINGPGATGAAFEMRIYDDDDTGTVNFSTPRDTVAMGAPEEPERFGWTSGVLPESSTRLFVVRVATAAWPAGLETQNTAAVTAPEAIDSDVPSTPTLETEII